MNIIIYRVSCNLEIHNELKEEYCICPFCDKPIDEVNSVLYDCCENSILIDDKHILCKNCGTIDGTRVEKEYADFYENRYTIRKKSIYHGKYLIKNTINGLVNVCRIDIPYELRQKILKICETIEPVIAQLNGN